MRGLKPRVSLLILYLVMSHLLQMRGLKLINPEARKKALESHLLQMRGLKLLFRLLMSLVRLVASFTDAWIETTTIFQPQTFK